ncbi:plasmid pRiA4b ORF-3 family protein [Allosaccharopolyspora coralli]|uniref:Plasmid pRiA4b ORF-3 family protein n=1 Tax=Allosaccharopolyspora coralli TaxID=2665642 RepID=A0A5Q3Q6B0_9PSEU|nr:plasmid pRiA4b ORF-3 family protein [Allosaccharopolyspora coralli]QGK68986.1 plasmid pRiA4b ORF-3 family protein [Allosaccharopolyspora coralli]
MTAKTKIFRIEIVLVDVAPLVRRVVEVPGEMSLAMLHAVVQEAMGWEHAHLHEFGVGGVRYGMPDPGWDAGVADESRTKLFRLVAAGDRMDYVYDFGDGWEHALRVEDVVDAEPGVRYPRCVDGQGACPPEDVGGVPGYQLFLETLADPAHPDHDDQTAWWGGDRFDAASFDLAAADRALEGLAWAPLAAVKS